MKLAVAADPEDVTYSSAYPLAYHFAANSCHLKPGYIPSTNRVVHNSDISKSGSYYHLGNFYIRWKSRSCFANDMSSDAAIHNMHELDG